MAWSRPGHAWQRCAKRWLGRLRAVSTPTSGCPREALAPPAARRRCLGVASAVADPAPYNVTPIAGGLNTALVFCLGEANFTTPDRSASVNTWRPSTCGTQVFDACLGKRRKRLAIAGNLR